MSEKMSNAPIYYALAQARFSPVAAMDSYISKIQDRLRRDGYPLYEPQQFTQLVIPGAIPGQIQPPEPKIQQAVSWLMTKSDRTAGFILEPSAITYHTTHYPTHKEFIPEFLRGLAAVNEEVSLDHVSRLGVRYLNAILPREGETIEKYFADGLHGINFGAIRRHTMTESVFSTNTSPLVRNGTLVIRVYRMHAHLGFPPDLFPSGLTPSKKFDIKEPVEHAVIDTDHYVEEMMPVEMQKLNEQLLSLHAMIESVFEVTTTDYARNVWN